MPRHPWNHPTALASATLLALTLAGCGSDTPSATPTDAPSSTRGTSSPTGESTGSPSTTAGDEVEQGSTTAGDTASEDGSDDRTSASPSDAHTSGTASTPSERAPESSPVTTPDPETSVTPSADPTQARADRSAGTTSADGSSAATSLSIPAVGLTTDLSPQGLRDGKVNPAPGQVIWFTGNGRARPGATGTSVIAGHVINRQGPDEFAALEQLETGDGVVLGYPGGEKLRLEVTSTDIVGKDELRTSADVWGSNSSTRRVVLITCDDQLGFRDDGHRKANFVAIAEVPS